jgi:ACT domain
MRATFISREAGRVSGFRSVTLAATRRYTHGDRLGDDRSVFLLRLIIPDRPGSLGTVATALGEVNADIHAIEIVEHRRENGTAVDDIVVDLPPGVLPDRLVSACNSVPDVEVIWFSRYGAGGGLHMDLEAVEQMTSAPADAVDILVEQAPAVLHADWAALLDGTGSEVKVALETSATPEFGDVTGEWLPLEKATTLVSPDDHKGLAESVLVAAPLESHRRILVIGRRGGPEFLGSEVARLSYLASLAVTIRATA